MTMDKPTSYLVDLGRLDMLLLKMQREWLASQDDSANRDGLTSLLDLIADELYERYGETEHLLDSE